MDNRSRSFSSTPFRGSFSVAHSTSNNHQHSHSQSQSAAAAIAAHAAAQSHANAYAKENDYWTHNEIDYNWRFPYPEHQQREFFGPDRVDEDRRRFPLKTAAPIEAWRSRDRMRTQCVALVACLNIGVDPPDVVKPTPCARIECWVDPESMVASKALKAIGGRLQLQYERWHERAKYKQLLDPTAEELRKALVSLRRVANEERVLFHYNGHGVPKATPNGEIWVYNKGCCFQPTTQLLLADGSSISAECVKQGMQLIDPFGQPTEVLRIDWGYTHSQQQQQQQSQLQRIPRSNRELKRMYRFRLREFGSSLTAPSTIAPLTVSYDHRLMMLSRNSVQTTLHIMPDGTGRIKLHHWAFHTASPPGSSIDLFNTPYRTTTLCHSVEIPEHIFSQFDSHPTSAASPLLHPFIQRSLQWAESELNLSTVQFWPDATAEQYYNYLRHCQSQSESEDRNEVHSWLMYQPSALSALQHQRVQPIQFVESLSSSSFEATIQRIAQQTLSQESMQLIAWCIGFHLGDPNSVDIATSAASSSSSFRAATSLLHSQLSDELIHSMLVEFATIDRVPSCILSAPVPLRRSVLAGLIDACGSISSLASSCILTLPVSLQNDVMALARGLGYSIFASKGEITTQYSLRGIGTELPLLDQKLVSSSAAVDPYLFTFHCAEVQQLEATHEYVGITVKGGQLLTADTVVVHNSDPTGPPTQYIPVSLYDLQTWMGGVTAPSIYVFDCNHGGGVVEAFQHFMAQRKEKTINKLKLQQNQTNKPGSKNNLSPSNGGDETHDSALDEAQLLATLNDPCRHILLAACGTNETLPTSPDLPADLFTACLTTPIKMALRWFVSRSLLNTHSNSADPTSGGGAGSASNRARMYELIDKLPGIRKPANQSSHANRKSPYGELNWIFTAITDSIAWNVLPRALFHKLFRQDLLVSSLFRNFLLAQRIMASYNCHVISVPNIPPTHLHPLWQCWDLASDIALSQLERFEKHGTPFTPSSFFEEQLTSFEIWLEFGSAARPPPMQLPIVLQVLLSTDHRLRALQLLARFMDKGTWAINLALSVGIFPYVLKLVESGSQVAPGAAKASTRELREVLVFIWAKILALDRAVSTDLSKVEYTAYFISHLQKHHMMQASPASANSLSSSGSRMHSRASSVTPSPLIRPSSISHSGGAFNSSQPSTPFFAFAQAPPTLAAPEQQQPLQQFQFAQGNANSKTFHPSQQQMQVDSSPLVHGAAANANRAAALPPLDLPPSNGESGATTHSAHLMDHPTQAGHMHMRAQPLHDPSIRTDDVASPPADTFPAALSSAVVPAMGGIDGENGSTENEDPLSANQLLPVRPAPQASPGLHPRVPFPLDLSAAPSNAANVSPQHSPSLGIPGVTKPSPMLQGIAFSPVSPMLSPIAGRTDGFASQARFDQVFPAGQEKKEPSAADRMADSHDLTRRAREALSTPGLQQLLSLFIIACIAHGNPKGQQTLMQSGLNSFKDLAASHLLFSPDARLRKWACLALGKCWQGFGHAKNTAATENIPETLITVLMDPVPEVRCAALWALGTFFGGKILTPATGATGVGAASASANSSSSPTNARAQSMRAQARLDLEIQLGAAMATLINDGSPMVRRELMLSLAELVYFQQDLFLSIATAHPRNRESISGQGWYIWRAILRGCRDCCNQVQEASLAIKGYLKGRAILNQNQLGRMIGSQHNPGLHFGGGFRESVPLVEEEDSSMDQMSDGTQRERDPSLSLSAQRNSVSRNSMSRSSLSSTQAPSTVDATTHHLSHIDADDLTGQDQEDSHGDDFFQQRDRAQPPAPVKHAQPPIRHFNRYKMGHLRPGASGPGMSGAPPLPGAGGARRNAEKSSILKSMEESKSESASAPANAAASNSANAGSSTGSIDERAADPMWTVPKSNVFEEAYAAFSDPLLLPPSEDPSSQQAPNPSMTDIRTKKWRYARNTAIVAHARDLRNSHPSKSSYVEVASLNAEWEATSCVLFHPFESMVIASDNHSAIGVWDYRGDEERGREKLNFFSNDNPPGSKITQLEIVNDAAVSLLLSASDDGVVRLWRHAHEEGRQQLVTAWVANPQPEVFYSNQPSANSHAMAILNNSSNFAPPSSSTASTQLDNNLVTPSHSYIESSPSMSSYTPQNRLSGRGMSTGVGMPINPSGSSVMSVGMRHSASTPALALSTATPSSRSNSLISAAGSLIPSATNSSLNSNVNRSPMLRASQGSPPLQPSSGAMNIPAYSLGGSAPAPTRSSPTLSPPTVSNTFSNAGGSSRRKQRPPLIIDWQQSRGRLLASGNGLECLRIWDVTQEQCVGDIPIFGHESLEAHNPTYVTSMNSNGGDLLWIGCADGALRHFDFRLPPIESLVSTARLHRSPVQSVRLQRHGHDGGMLISASIGGDIALADVRMADSAVIRYHRSSHKDKNSSLDAFAVHDYSAICASGSHKPFIEIFDHSGMTLSTITHHIGFLSPKIAPVTALAFHPFRLLLAAGGIGSNVTIFESGAPLQR